MEFDGINHQQYDFFGAFLKIGYAPTIAILPAEMMINHQMMNHQILRYPSFRQTHICIHICTYGVMGREKLLCYMFPLDSSGTSTKNGKSIGTMCCFLAT